MTLKLLEQPTQERGVTLYSFIMAPLSPEHEDSKSTVGLLLEAYLREKHERRIRRSERICKNYSQ